MNADRQNEFGQVPRLWPGRTVFIVAGGPSLRGFDFERLRGRHVLVINAFAHDVPWADCLFFTDNGWFEQNRTLVETWAGTVLTVSRAAKRALPDKIVRLQAAHVAGILSADPGVVCAGRSSGHTAVNIAALAGAARAVLLGYDMRPVDGRAHGHDRYAGKPVDLNLYASTFVPAFAGFNAAALRLGLTVVNATPGSALTEFPATTLDDELALAKAA